MAFVFVLVALLLLIAVLVISGAFNANNQAQAVGIKYGVLNSAEAAANLALNRLADNPNEKAGCVQGSLNNANYLSCLGLNNLNWPTPRTATDYANGKQIWVPAYAAYIYGEATNSNNRRVYVEAIAQPAPPLTMPSGAINAVRNINDMTDMPVNQDPLFVNDADMFANNNLTKNGHGSPVQGITHAVGTDSLIGADGTTHSGSSAMRFPNASQVAQASQNAKLIAQSGTTISGAALSGGTSTTYTGNVYVDGDVNISAGTITFASGTDVYINGNLCISGTGSLVNGDGKQGMLVVSGVVSSSGTGGYKTAPGQNSILMSLATDPGSSNPCGSATEAIYLAPAAGIEPVATVYAANGSVGVWGAGKVQGALDAGVDVNLAGATGATMEYDAKQSSTTLATGTMTYTAYNQD